MSKVGKRDASDLAILIRLQYGLFCCEIYSIVSFLAVRVEAYYKHYLITVITLHNRTVDALDVVRRVNRLIVNLHNDEFILNAD